MFWNALDTEFRTCSATAGKLIMGGVSARVGHADAGESTRIVPFTWGRRALHQVDVPNRNLLMEFCFGLELRLANTYFERPLEDAVAFMVAGARPLGPITEGKYNILDYIMCDAPTLVHMRKLETHRGAALATDHYLMTVDTQRAQHDDPLPRKPPRDRSASRPR
eukprot:4601557-Pyramimonas_sp.AAC.1